ncbi:MAG: hypothetical protein AAGC93_01405 [Cyanobacteria bacterium P01_F01_bin.53]
MDHLSTEGLENGLVNILANIDLASIELKFLRKLLDAEDHRASITALKPNSRTSAVKCGRICQSLADRGFVEYDSEICRFTLSAPGRMLLSLQTTSLPVTPDELKLLRACRGPMTPDKLGNCVPVNMRSHLISGLVERKLLKVIKRTITEVRLTETGKAALVRQFW